MTNKQKLREELFKVLGKEEYKDIPVVLMRNLELTGGINIKNNMNEVVIHSEGNKDCVGINLL